MTSMQTEDFDYRGFGHRLRVTRIALGITEAQAATAAGCSVDTWRKYEATGKGRCTIPVCRFARHHNVSLDWIFCGDPRGRTHRTQGKVAILPVKGPWYRQGQAVQS
jgi:transcriptional regulator with XRE-family HTH domain